jgi:hypothetical protein
MKAAAWRIDAPAWNLRRGGLFPGVVASAVVAAAATHLRDYTPGQTRS